MSQPYRELKERLLEISDLKHAEALLEWDQQTFMPPNGNEARARQTARLSAIAHEKVCEPKLGELLDRCGEDESLADNQKAMVKEAKRDRDRAVKVPTDLVREITETAAKAHMVWAKARETNDFKLFAPYLLKLVDLRTREAEAVGFAEGGVAYDALLDQYEAGATTKMLDPILEKTREIVVPAVSAIAAAEKKPDAGILKRSFAVEGQKAFSLQVLEQMSYDFDSGRLDEAVHPFSTSFDIDDVRITTRYDKDWLPGAIFGTIHEAGHALYEMGLPKEHTGTPLAEARSLGYHESQSRFWENQIGRSLPFWKFFLPKLKSAFPGVIDDVSLEDFHFAVNNVQPSFIRVEADEVTYNLHIIVRYEMEKAIFEKSVKVEELPGLWNDKMEAYLGVRPTKDAEGVLQDIHWSFGGFGYFPTYLLGNLYAAQWMAALQRDFSELDSMIARGDLLPIRTWLKEKIHKHGRRYTADELARRVSGETLNPEHFDHYLRERFGKLYGVEW